MDKKFIIIICSLFFALGGLLVTQGITGMYSWDRFDSFCESDSKCGTSQVCCKFFDEDYGVCNKFSNCASISMATMEEKQHFSVLNPPEPAVSKVKLFDSVRHNVEEPRSDNNRNSVVVGLIIIAFAIGVYLFTRVHMKPIILVKKQRSRN